MWMAERERVTVTVLGAAALVGIGALMWQARRAPIGVANGPPPSAAQWDARVDRAQRLDVNHATAQELERLPGIGPVAAERIVAYREAHGPFVEPDDLLSVQGIGPATVKALQDDIRVE